MAYVFLMVAIICFMVIQAIIRFRRVFRIQALALLTAIIMLILTELVYVSGLLPIPGLDLAPFSFTISDLIFT